MEQQGSPQGPSSKGHSGAAPHCCHPPAQQHSRAEPSPAFDGFSLPTVQINNFREGILTRAGPPLSQLWCNEIKGEGEKKGLEVLLQVAHPNFGDVLAFCTPPPAVPGRPQLHITNL